MFDYEDDSQMLLHIRTINDVKFVRFESLNKRLIYFSPNNIVALGPESFIVTNDGLSQTSSLNELEIATGFPGGSLVYYDQWLNRGCRNFITQKGSLSGPLKTQKGVCFMKVFSSDAEGVMYVQRLQFDSRTLIDRVFFALKISVIKIYYSIAFNQKSTF